MKLPQTVPHLFRKTAQDWVMEARKAARDLLLKRLTITIEDVLLVCPRPGYLHRNVTGNVFRDDVFRHVGYTRSRRPIQHSSVIRVWTLNEEYFPDSMLAHRRRTLEEYERDD